MDKNIELNQKLSSIGCGVVASSYVKFRREDIPNFLVEAYQTKDFRAVSVCNKWLEMYDSAVPGVRSEVCSRLTPDEMEFMESVPPAEERKMPDYSAVIRLLEKNLG